MPDAAKLSDKKSDEGNRRPTKAWYRKGNNYKKTTSHPTFIGGTEELETDIFTCEATMEKDRVNSKEEFVAYATVKHGTNIRESLKKHKAAAYNNPVLSYNNPAPADILVDKEGKPTSVTAVEK